MDESNTQAPVTIEALPMTLTVEEAGRLLRLSRHSAFQAAKRGDIPTIRIGRRLIVPRAKLLEMLGEQLREAA